MVLVRRTVLRCYFGPFRVLDRNMTKLYFPMQYDTFMSPC